MNGKLYSHNLVEVANRDGAGASISQTENIILGLWASALTGQYEAGLDYFLWQTILFEKTGVWLSGVTEQRLVVGIVEAITGVSQNRGWNKFELISEAADSSVLPSNAFTLIGSTEPFTLIGQTTPFTLIP